MTTPLSVPLDVRTIPPFICHATIFGRLEQLTPHEALTLVDDHDPAPFRSQIDGRYPGAFGWTYLAQGPELWQVEIDRHEGEINASNGDDFDCYTYAD